MIKRKIYPVKLSIIIAILDSHKIVIKQMKHFKRMYLPNDIEIIFIDDGSNPPLSTLPTHGIKNMNIYPTMDKRPWTQPCARNLGAMIAEGEMLLFTDVDHIIPSEVVLKARSYDGDKLHFNREYGVLDYKGNLDQSLNSLVRHGLTRKRFNARGVKVHRHTNTFAMRKRIFEELGGYPPRYCNMGKHDIWEDSNFYHKYRKYTEAGRCRPQELGGTVYVYPASNTDPLGLFHSLPYG